MISCIIPTYNESENLLHLIPYLKKYSSCEIIVVDGGSCDDTVSIAKSFDVRVFTSEKSRSKQLNAGAKKANGSILYFLHADTLPPQTFENNIISSVEQYDAGCFQPRFDMEHPVLTFSSWMAKLAWTCFRFGDQSLFLRKEVFNAIGGYDEKLILGEGNALIRTLRKQYSFTVVHKDIIISSRMYQKYRVVRTQITYIIAYLLLRLGISHIRIKKIMKQILK